MSIGERILTALDRAGKAQADLARYLSTRTSTITGWVKEGRIPAASSIAPICEFTGVSMEWLLTGEEPSGGSLSVAGSVSGSAIVQGNNSGRVIVRNGRERVLSEEAGELLRVYESLDMRRRIKLLDMALSLEEEKNNK